MPKTRITLLFINLILSFSVFSQATYIREQFNITNMLNGTTPLDLRKAVYSVENAWHDDNLNKKAFNDQIELYAQFCQYIIQTGDIRYDGKGDEQAAKTQAAVFVFMTDSVPIQKEGKLIWHLPFTYNFDDYTGRKDWSSMFVSTLMETGKGNCHSMPLLYKMIMDTLGEKSWLALAPNHMYIKAWNKRAGWYNIELTCAEFPTDAWLSASGYVHLDAIRNGCYMDTLSLKQSVALCLTDLAQGYMRKYGVGDGRFILECCNTTLEHFPNYLNALHIKAEVITQTYLKETDKTTETALSLKTQMDEIYTTIHKLGYRKMPTEMYLNWLYSLNEHSSQYRTKKVTIYKKENY